MKRILSLFDYSGTWPSPFAHSGWDVVMIDLQDGEDIYDINEYENNIARFEEVHGLLAAVPCTDFANTGARWFAEKDKDGRTCASVALCQHTLSLMDSWRPTDFDYMEYAAECPEEEPFFWAIENPVGRIATLVPEMGKPHYFNPCDFAGYLDLSVSDHNELDRLRRKDGKGFTAEERQFVIDCNAYTKKTGLWGEFNREMVEKPIEPVRCNKYGSPMMSYGGSSEKTKRARSNTPEGFAIAFHRANNSWNPFIEEFESFEQAFDSSPYIILIYFVVITCAKSIKFKKVKVIFSPQESPLKTTR